MFVCVGGAFMLRVRGVDLRVGGVIIQLLVVTVICRKEIKLRFAIRKSS